MFLQRERQTDRQTRQAEQRTHARAMDRLGFFLLCAFSSLLYLLLAQHYECHAMRFGQWFCFMMLVGLDDPAFITPRGVL
mmetsp:Transcript_54968/g.107512  ORF Transcript_54968/g.107512 Transcript_54968/m.107512 type:complete len:80 (+) Transcript_54968:76-315(+)